MSFDPEISAPDVLSIAEQMDNTADFRIDCSPI